MLLIRCLPTGQYVEPPTTWPLRCCCGRGMALSRMCGRWAVSCKCMGKGQAGLWGAPRRRSYGIFASWQKRRGRRGQCLGAESCRQQAVLSSAAGCSHSERCKQRKVLVVGGSCWLVCMGNDHLSDSSPSQPAGFLLNFPQRGRAAELSPAPMFLACCPQTVARREHGWMCPGWKWCSQPGVATERQ